MVEIYVRQNNGDQALRALKKKLQNEGINWRANVPKSKV